VRRALAAVLMVCCVVPLTIQRAASPQSAVTITVTRNFYSLETWEPGKDRRWMSNGGEIELASESPAEINLRFLAESFHNPRTLTVALDGAVPMTVFIPPAASRYVVVKHLRVPAGKLTLRFNALPGPARVKDSIPSSDAREISVAFGPFSTVAASSPEGLIEQTGAFPEANWHRSFFTAEEEAANDLRRQGRFTEGLVKYRTLVGGGAASQLSYVWAGLCALILGAPDEAQSLFRSSHKRPEAPAVRVYAERLANGLDEFVARSELLRRADPVSSLRTSGEIYLAVPEYESRLRANPDDVVANLWLGLIYAAAERVTEARSRFDRVTKVVPETYDAKILRDLLNTPQPREPGGG
jgi:tetratricopeptide (TPR) repeat protein